MTRSAFAPLVALVAAAVAVPTLAQPAAHVMVRYGDLDFNNPADIRVLARRVDGAVYYVCGGEPASVAEEGANADYRACRRDTMAAALKSIGRPRPMDPVEGPRLTELARR